MYAVKKTGNPDMPFFLVIGFLLLLSVIVLNSIAPTLFPFYYLYLVLGVIAFIFFANIDFDVISLFSKHLYIISIILLILPLIIGQVTRGAIRWIPIGALTIQPAEIVRPLLLVFFANYITKERLTLNHLLRAIGLLLIPLALIFIQPSLGVTILMAVGFVGILIASGLKKGHFFAGVLILLISLPLSWNFMKDYQKDRILSFVNPASDPGGAGYNAIQSMIAVGSGGLTGKGLGRGVQTQLAFLPEKHSDFILAAVSEELGFLGAVVLLALTFYILFKLVKFTETAKNLEARVFVSGFFLMYLVQVIIHSGMNLGLLPITGLTFPLVSAGGSSLLATMMGLGIALGARKK